MQAAAETHQDDRGYGKGWYVIMKFGISGQGLGKVFSLEETLDIIKGLGVDYIEIWPCNIASGEGSVNGDTYENRDAEKAAVILREKKISVSAVSFSGAFVEKLAMDEERYAEELTRAVETAHILGAGFLNHYCYYLSLDHMDIDRLKRCMMPALSLAQQYGIIMVLENEAHDMTKTPAEMKNILDSFGQKHFKTNYDAVNYYQAGEEGFPFAYGLLKEKIAYVHIKNGCVYREASGNLKCNAGGPMNGRLGGETICYTPLEEGAVNIAGVLKRLVRDDYQGFCVIEPHCPPEDTQSWLEKDVKWLHEIYHDIIRAGGMQDGSLNK